MLRTTDALYAALDNAPAALLIADASGEIVYRNRAAATLVAATVAKHGEAGLRQLQTSLKDDARSARTFPVERTKSLDFGGDTLVYGHSIMERIPTGGFIVTWADTTDQVVAGQTIRQLAGELASASSELTVAGQELVLSSEQASGQADAVSKGSSEMTESIREIALRVNNATSSTDSVVSSAHDAARNMAQLQDSSREIGSIVKLITAIAEQTKLLALNATIEAARAGEMGKGFGVVADEVKDLAARTAEATQQIIGMIEGIQNESGQAADGISGITELIDQVAEQQTMIASAVEEQSATSSEMSGGMQAVASSVQASAAAAEAVLTAAAVLQDQATRLGQVSVVGGH